MEDGREQVKEEEEARARSRRDCGLRYTARGRRLCHACTQPLAREKRYILPEHTYHLRRI